FESLDWKALILFSASEARTFMGFGLSAGVTTVTNAGTGINFNAPAGLPDLISIGQNRLNTDGGSVTLDLTQPIDISFVPDLGGNTFYRIIVYDLIAGPPAMRVPVVEADTTVTIDNVPHFTLRPQLFTAGHSYTIEAMSIQGGNTNAAMGDLQTVTLPLTLAYQDSGVFTVVAK